MQAIAPTSYDANYAPENMVRNGKGFWMTTGMFPQEVTIQLDQETSVEQIRITCTNVQKVILYGSSDTSSPSLWDVLGEAELSDTDGRLQMESIQIDPSRNDRINFIKVHIAKGWDDFVSVHKVEINNNK